MLRAPPPLAAPRARGSRAGARSADGANPPLPAQAATVRPAYDAHPQSHPHQLNSCRSEAKMQHSAWKTAGPLRPCDNAAAPTRALFVAHAALLDSQIIEHLKLSTWRDAHCSSCSDPRQRPAGPKLWCTVRAQQTRCSAVEVLKSGRRCTASQCLQVFLNEKQQML